MKSPRQKTKWLLLLIFIFLAGIIYILDPYSNLYSSTWRKIKLTSADLNSTSALIQSIDSKSTTIDSRAEALSDCYLYIIKNRNRFKKYVHEASPENIEIFRSSLRKAFGGHRDNIANRAKLDTEYNNLVDYIFASEVHSQ